MSCLPPRKKRITKNYFRLVGNSELYYNSEVLIDFKPLRKRKGVTNPSVVPTFTNDRKYFTSSFTLPSDQMECDQELIQDHERRVKQLCFQIEEIYVPKPRSKSKYCGVCRGHYQDYKDHIQSESHMSKLYHSNYQALIHKMCHRFQDKLKSSEGEESKNHQPSTAEQNQIKSVDSILLRTAIKNNQ